jgi:hypothetical protein
MFLDHTLEELDGQDWGEPSYPSSLAIDCHRLRHGPLKDFTDGDLGRLIRQKFSLDFLVPMTLMRLMEDPFAGDIYNGEMIVVLLSLPADFWLTHPDLRLSLKVAIAKAQRLNANQGAFSCGVDDALIDQLLKYEDIDIL